MIVTGILVVIFGSGVWRMWSSLTRPDHVTARIARFANLTVAYGIESRRMVADDVRYFVAASGEIEYQSYSSDGSGCVIRFKNGKECSFVPDGEHLYWIDQYRGVESTKVDDVRTLIDRVDDARPVVSERVFATPSEFLRVLKESKQNKSAHPTALSRQFESGLPARRRMA